MSSRPSEGKVQLKNKIIQLFCRLTKFWCLRSNDIHVCIFTSIFFTVGHDRHKQLAGSPWVYFKFRSLKVSNWLSTKLTKNNAILCQFYLVEKSDLHSGTSLNSKWEKKTEIYWLVIVLENWKSVQIRLLSINYYTTTLNFLVPSR